MTKITCVGKNEQRPLGFSFLSMDEKPTPTSLSSNKNTVQLTYIVLIFDRMEIMFDVSSLPSGTFMHLPSSQWNEDELFFPIDDLVIDAQTVTRYGDSLDLPELLHTNLRIKLILRGVHNLMYDKLQVWVDHVSIECFDNASSCKITNSSLTKELPEVTYYGVKKS